MFKCKYGLIIIIVTVCILLAQYQRFEKETIQAFEWSRFCSNDYKNCPVCFSDQTDCMTFLDRVHLKRSLVEVLLKLFGTRLLQYGHYYEENLKAPESVRPIYEKRDIVIKHIANAKILNRFKTEIAKRSIYELNIWNSIDTAELTDLVQRWYLSSERPDTVQLYPWGVVDRFIEVFKPEWMSVLHAWVLININAEPLLLPILYENQFPVPKLYMHCGFVMVESYNGVSLYHYYSAPYKQRIQIARNLLKAALKFTEGYKSFRFLLTDATPDNIMVDEKTLDVTFVDLDTLIILDSNYTEHIQFSPRMHRHNKINCDGCFSYAPDELSNCIISDINLFAMCQIFTENLQGHKPWGFLYKPPKAVLSLVPNFELYIHQCYHCDNDCTDRFGAAKDLIDIFQHILDRIED